MKLRTLYLHILMLFTGLLTSCHIYAQDTIYTHTKGEIYGKVTEVWPSAIYFVPDGDTSGKNFYVGRWDVDSVVYANGKVEKLHAVVRKRNRVELGPLYNTWTFDQLGFVFLSVSQSYERRLKDERIGFRVPLYIGFIGGGIAGVGTFKPDLGVYYPDSKYYYNSVKRGTSLATGLNLKYYAFKNNLIRIFVGPEATIGYSSAAIYIHDSFGGFEDFPSKLIYYGTCTAIGKVGISINPVPRFNITLDGGAGVGDIFGHAKTNPNIVGFTELWHVGFALGTNF